MTKKAKRRAPRISLFGGKTPSADLESKARQDLTAGRFREAIATYKQLLKREARAEWRAALADATQRGHGSWKPRACSKRPWRSGKTALD